MTLRSTLDRIVARGLASVGLKVGRIRRDLPPPPAELGEEDARILGYVATRGLSMASPERMWTTLMACHHVIDRGIEGDFVECGVWRGGNSILAADVFRRRSPDRGLFLFDTFAGMTAPTANDVDCDGQAADGEFRRMQREGYNDWCYASRADVESNLLQAGVALPHLRLIHGDVLQTLRDPENLPARIAVLRLDTDWYESTRMELDVLYPLLQPGGVLIIDDYGHWGGAKKAVEEYFRDRPRPFLQYTDYTGRAGVKPDP